MHVIRSDVNLFSVAVEQQRVVAQFGSALDWGSRGRWFESSPPDQIGELAQLGERVTGSHEVRGSNPLISTRSDGWQLRLPPFLLARANSRNWDLHQPQISV